MSDKTFQITIWANPITDADFLSWWQSFSNGTTAKLIFLAYIRLGMREVEIAREHFDALCMKNCNHSTPPKKRGRPPAIPTKKAQSMIRIALNRKVHADIVHEWMSLIYGLKGPVFLMYWRIARRKHATIPIQYLGSAPAESPSSAIDPERTSAPVNENDRGAYQNLCGDLDRIADLHLRSAESESVPPRDVEGPNRDEPGE